uniref:bifunctional tRNA (5-methylaminomethyl-2-thiouridine)(34)-methyltransferase MnmD/FAD-dependent 5-carboxymethylaminomethyl-2-thiouridine(34) oxidoreductase MnmC n=1 Tax=Thaumasiovibrio occultus TaxID=1891184 RepID=UPI000B359D50|nr:bifunctional tRNA (5-methylaminomethyl-2-thiouridine)(34)-methyltransferase MnmD/FAD-dependent 5-carboxymethylaminomethyl-2-thiouridine(34) oxidoreductase MnmC [Thaumasiovibrio occultus]
MNRSRIDHAKLDWNESGTPVSNAFDDVYFSNQNGLEETRYVFIKQNHIPERWSDFERQQFVIAETGFGTGLNFLAAWQTFRQFRRDHPDAPLQRLHFISFEKFPVSLDDLKKAHLAWPELAELAPLLHRHYPPAVADCHRIVLDDGQVTLDLWFGDIQDCLPQVSTGHEGIVDCWFLDGFAPSKNEAMWSQSVFDGMARLARLHCTTATFTAAGFVRRGLIDAGFAMKKVKGFGTKREMLAGDITERQHKASFTPWYAYQPTTHNDIAIIGGGVATAATALALAMRGKDITIYCKDSELAQGASGNQQGAVYPLLNERFDALSRFFSTGFIYARQLAELVHDEHPFDHQWCGVTQLMYDEKSTSKLERILQADFDPMLAQRLDATQTNTQLGVEVDMAAVNYPLGGWVYPQGLTTAMIDRARTLAEHNGGSLTLVTDCPVTALEQDNDGWQLKTTQGDKYHQVVVIANGHHFAELEQTAAVPAYPVRGQVSHIPTNESLRSLKSVVCYDGYLTPENNDHHCIGASYDRNQTALEFSETHQQGNKQRLIHCLPEASWPQTIDVSQNRARVGVRTASRDHLPFVGNVVDFSAMQTHYAELQHNQADAEAIASYPNLYCLLALGSRGLSSAPILGETLAAMICGEPLPYPQSVLDALHPGRMWVRKLLKGKAI